MGPVHAFVSDIYEGIINLHRDGAITNEEATVLSIELAQVLTRLARALGEEQPPDVIPSQYDDRGYEYDYRTDDDIEFDRIIDSYERDTGSEGV